MYERITLPNGVRLLTDRMDGVRSAAVGIWVGVGSRAERPRENGAAHYIEHMLFKGTKSYTARGLADKMDTLGGQFNAYTTRESTCFYARVPDYSLHEALDVLGEMFFDALLDEQDVNGERSVIREEVDMYNDSPEDLVVERLLTRSFPGALGRPVLGTPKTLAGMTGAGLRQFMEDNYTADRVVLAMAGSFDDSHIRTLTERFSAMPERKGRAFRRGRYVPSLCVKHKATEQNHLCLGFEGPCSAGEDRFAMNLLSWILGGGVSSRLFQSVREEHGLCYSINSFGAGFAETGLLGIETPLGRQSQEQALGLIFAQLRDIREHGVTARELDRARAQIEAGLFMSLESTSARMNRLGGGELAGDPVRDPDEILARYEAVTRDEVLTLAQRTFDFSRMSFSAVGRVECAPVWQDRLAAAGGI